MQLNELTARFDRHSKGLAAQKGLDEGFRDTLTSLSTQLEATQEELRFLKSKYAARDTDEDAPRRT